jgi:hypothetical protein
MPQGRVAVVVPPGAPAAWVFVVGQNFLAAVPVGTAGSVVDSLIERAHDHGVELESLVALLPLTGPDALGSFLVVVQRESTDADGIPVSAVVRGTAAADVFSIGGSRRFGDRGIRPWLLADFRAVTGLVIGSIDAPVLAAGGLSTGRQVETGACTGNALFWSVLASPGSGPESKPESGPEDASNRGLDPVGPAALQDATPARQHDRGADYDTEIRAPRSLDHDDTVLRIPRDHWAGSERPASLSPESALREPTSRDADTVLRPPRAARHDQHQEGDGGVGDTTTLGAPGQDPLVDLSDGDRAGLRPKARDDVARYAFHLPPAEPHRLDRAYVLGRNPRLPRIVRGEPPTLLIVASPTSAVSSTHLEIRQQGDSVVVTDLGSTNGTVVRPPRGRPRRLRSGQSLAVTPGTVVDIGDGNIVEILR